MATLDTIVQSIVIIGFVIWAYSAVKRQTIKDTFDEIKDFLHFIGEQMKNG